MLKRPPYWLWLAASLLLWTAAAVRYFQNEQNKTPEYLAEILSRDLQSRIRNYQNVKNNRQLIQNIFSGRLSDEDQLRLYRQPFYINAYEDGKLVFWNSNKIIAPCDAINNNKLNKGSVLGKNIFFTSCDTVADPVRHRTLSMVIPLAWIYPFENEYLQSRWVASDLIPASSLVSQEPREGYLPVYYEQDKPGFYIKTGNENGHGGSDAVLLLLFFAAVAFSITWVQLTALYIAERHRPAAGLMVIAGTAVLLKIILVFAGFPFQLHNLQLFSPHLFASSKLLPSLGDLLINGLLLLWIVLFIFARMNYRSPVKAGRGIRTILCVLVTALIAALAFYPAGIIRSLVLDSKISFDVGSFGALDVYSFIGLAAILIITGLSAISIHILHAQLSSLVRNRTQEYFLLILAGAVYIACVTRGEQLFFSLSVLAWLLLFLALDSVRRLSVTRKLFTPNMIFWAVFLCLSATSILHHFNTEKERRTRIAFASRLLRLNDPLTQYLFLDIGRNLSRDEQLRQFLRRPSQEGRNALNDHIDILFLKGHLNNYQSDIYVFDSLGYGLYNTDTTGIQSFFEKTGRAAPVSDSFLYFKEDARDGHYYLAKIEVRNEDASVAGYVFIDLALKKANSRAVYPELLQPEGIRDVLPHEEYEYAIYYRQKLITQTSDYPFKLLLPSRVIHTSDHRFVNRDNASELWYKADADRKVVVVYHPDTELALVTLFSYLLSLQLLLTLFASSYRTMLYYFNSRKASLRPVLTLRRRIHYGMLGVVLISFLIIGIVTVNVFRARYEEDNRKRMQAAMQVVGSSVQQFLGNHHALRDRLTFTAQTSQPDFNYFITSLANQQLIDINVYNASARLMATSQTDIYDKSLQSRIMRSDAYQKFLQKNISQIVQTEKIGNLSYLSGYLPIRNDEGTTLGYVNVPYFAAQKEINDQISDVLVALINIYVFIFLISSFIAVLITNSLTRSLDLIIHKFSRLNLQKNELLEWKYDDEIGMLVKAYNSMVRQVEELADKLAETERETAWREMARQVAHEIKNPLTPMKLHIQYLQQALQQNHPNVTELSRRVAESLIEQIDNLNLIASEFSSFAKLPEAKPEYIELNEFLERFNEMYTNDENVKTGFTPWSEPVRLFIDRSQLLSICTNLVQNAIQAIPDSQEGRIGIKLIRSGNDAVIHFTDNGIGIAADIRDKIFKPYFTSKSSGTGLGLAMTKKMIEFWKGEIWFESREGRGTTFFVKLPLEK